MSINGQMQPMTANPPYIKFETRAISRQRPATEGAGLYSDDVDYALVTSHGSKDTVERVVAEWFPYLQDQVKQGRFPQEWLNAYKASYTAWKSNEELPVIGTPIKNWPAATPKEVKNCILVGLRAVEDLANANEELIGRLGMGGRALSQRAKDWVQTAKSQAPIVAEIEAARGMLVGKDEEIRQLKEANTSLQAQLIQYRNAAIDSAAAGIAVNLPSLEDRLTDARARVEAGLTDDEAISDALELEV